MNKHNRILLFSFFLVVNFTIYGQEWKASWITANNVQNLPNTWICFRKIQTIDSIPSVANALIATDTKYWLWINGNLVVFEGGLKRGPNPHDTYYDEVNIAPYLVKGDNSIAVLTWYMGKDGFSHVSSGKSGLLFQCSTSSFEILSDYSWKSRVHPAFQSSPGRQPNFRLSESNILFDARKDLNAWQTLKYSDKQWNNAFVYGKAPMYPWNNLHPRPIPQWKKSQLLSYTNKRDLNSLQLSDTVVCVLPGNLQVTPYLKINAPDGMSIQILTDNYLGGGEANMRAEYITRKGIQEFECYGWLNGQKVYYVIPKGVEVIELKYRESGYDTEFSGKFSCSDSFMNLLWEKSLRTLYVTMRDNYMDCPDRERAQWWGDEVIEGGESFYALCPKSHMLFRKGMYELIGWQKENGILFSPIPAGNWNQELPSQMLASVGEYGFWNYFLHTGDTIAIADNYEGVLKYMDLWKVKDDGTLVYRQGGWPWGDWGIEVDVELIENAWYYLALKGVLKMSTLLGYRKMTAVLTAKMKRFKESFNKQFWMGDAYRHYNYTGKTDDRAQALAVLAGLADSTKYPDIFKIFQVHRYASPYMEKYVMESLFVMGYEDYALQRTREKYSSMVNDSSYYTLFEGWGIGNKGYGGGTTNHAWSGGPLTVLMQYLCGISPVEAGYKKFKVFPQPGSMQNASASILSVKGRISTSFKNEHSEFKLTIDAPPATSVLAGIPAKKVNYILLNGKVVWRNNKPVKNSRVQSGYVQDDFVCFDLPPGNWSFVAKKITDK